MKLFRNDTPIILAIFLVALTLRLVFVLAHPQPPPKWDSVSYISKARDIPYSFTSWPVFKGTMRDLAKRGPVYPIFLSLFTALSGDRLTAIRVAQSLLDALVCVFLFLIARLLASRRAGIIAGVLSAIYTPFLFSASFIMQECLTGFLLVVTVWFLVKASQRHSSGLFYGAGISLALVMFCRPAMLYLPLFLIVAVWIVNRDHRRTISVFITGILTVFLPWMIILAVIPPRYPVKIVFGYGENPWIVNYLGSDGWIPEADKLEELNPVEESLGKTVRSSYSPRERIIYLQRTVLAYPGRLGSIFVKNIFRLYAYPYRAYWPPLGLSDLHLAWFQRFLVFFALIGLPLSIFRKSKAMIPASILVYNSLLIPLVTVVPRYNVPVMPLVILFASLALNYLIKGLGKCWARKARGRPLFSGGIFLLLSVFLVFLPLPVLVRFASGLEVSVLRWFRIALINIWIIFLCRVVYLSAATQDKKRTALSVSLCFFFFLAGIVNFRIFTDMRWTGWSARITEPGQRVRKEFILDEEFNLKQYYNPSVFIDMRRNPGADFPVIVRADGREINADFRPAGLAPPYRFISSWRGLRLEDMRQWVEVPIDISLLEDGKIEIDIIPSGSFGKDEDYLDIWGDYRARRGYYSGPALPDSSRPEFIASGTKWVTDWDRRLDTVTPLLPARVKNSFGSREDSSPDLSSTTGLQTGEYRIRLMLHCLPDFLMSSFNPAVPVNYIPGVTGIVRGGEKIDGQADFLSGPSQTDTAYLIRAGVSAGELTWESASCPEKRQTILEFVGNSSRAAGKIELSINDRPVLSFQTGRSKDTVWNGAGCRLIFRFKEKLENEKVPATFFSGVYFLSVPASLVEPGKKLTLKAKFNTSAAPGCWFALKEYKPTTEIEYKYF